MDQQEITRFLDAQMVNQMLNEIYDGSESNPIYDATLVGSAVTMASGFEPGSEAVSVWLRGLNALAYIAEKYQSDVRYQQGRGTGTENLQTVLRAAVQSFPSAHQALSLGNAVDAFQICGRRMVSAGCLNVSRELRLKTASLMQARLDINNEHDLGMLAAFLRQTSEEIDAGERAFSRQVIELLKPLVSGVKRPPWGNKLQEQMQLLEMKVQLPHV